mmetsp:Transcript_16925/g.39348  ORF Transcript_16925/g.39348 Transcript_16925/m.39348 type:complete len:80 (+) Transcript_16925:43-282(+)
MELFNNPQNFAITVNRVMQINIMIHFHFRMPFINSRTSWFCPTIVCITSAGGFLPRPLPIATASFCTLPASPATPNAPP